MAFECIICTNDDVRVEFPNVRELRDHELGGHVSRPITTLTQVAPKKQPANEPQATPVTPPAVDRKPIGLVYRYEGSCETCSGDLDTIGVDTGTKKIMIAYCSPCKKQYTQQEVIAIDQQDKYIPG